MLHRRACNLCEAICGLVIEVENGHITRIEGDKKDPLSKGHICPKAFALKDVYEDPNRLKTPVKRTAEGWKSISWEEALSETAERLHGIQQQYGNNAVGIYHGNPSVHNLGTIMNTGGLIKALKTQNVFTATSVDQLPHHFASWTMFGHPLLFPVPDISRTDFFLILGGNPLASNGSMMTAPNVGGHISEIKKRGGKVVVVDPRRTETAERASEHIFIRPSSDVFLLLAMLKVLFDENLVNTGKNAIFTEGGEFVKKAVSEFDLADLAAQTGISTTQIKQLTRDFAAAKSGVVYGRMGVSVQRFGGVCQWLVNCLNILTGNFDREGGAMFPQPAMDILMGAKPRNIFSRWKSRVRGLPEFMGELPVSVLSEEILTEGEGQIRAMVTNCGNPVLSTPNGLQVEKAFKKLDFYVAFDIYINETTCHADIILPPATGLEVSHYDVTFHLLAIRNTAKYSSPLFEKSENARFDYEIMQELAFRLNQLSNPQSPDPNPQNTEGVNFIAESPEVKLDFALRFGPHKLSIEQLKAQPEGIDLGALRSCLPERLVHADKKIQLAIPFYLQDLERVNDFMKNTPPQYLTDNQAFTLIGRRHQRDCNSWLHNSEKLMKGKNRCTLLLHPDDAAALQVNNHEIIKVSSRVGSVEVETEISDQIMRGVVSLPHGYGHNRKGVQLDTAKKYAGVSVNDLTDDQVIDELTGNAAVNSVLVKIERLN
jgi:anaerobic selenocysteine-containing dehydrogenase